MRSRGRGPITFADRVLFTLAALMIYRLGLHLPLPGIDLAALSDVRSSGRIPSIFVLGITPYLSASFVLLVLGFLLPPRSRFDRYARIGAVLIAALQAYGLATGLESMTSAVGPLVPQPGGMFRATIVASLGGGTIFLLWLADQVTARGVGNGILLIILADLVKGLPPSFASLIEMGRTGALSTFFVLAFLVLMVATVFLICHMERAQRRIRVQFATHEIGGVIVNGGESELVLKLNMAGIIPPIFASQIMLLPLTIAGYSAGQDGFAHQLAARLAHGSPTYIGVYSLLIILFAYLYAALVSGPGATAKSLHRYHGTVSGIASGRNTARYLRGLMARLTLVGGVYLAAICVLPELLISRYNVPFYFGGARLLVIVCIFLDTLWEIRARLVERHTGTLASLGGPV